MGFLRGVSLEMGRVRMKMMEKDERVREGENGGIVAAIRECVREGKIERRVIFFLVLLPLLWAFREVF